MYPFSRPWRNLVCIVDTFQSFYVYMQPRVGRFRQLSLMMPAVLWIMLLSLQLFCGCWSYLFFSWSISSHYWFSNVSFVIFFLISFFMILHSVYFCHCSSFVHRCYNVISNPSFNSFILFFFKVLLLICWHGWFKVV